MTIYLAIKTVFLCFFYSLSCLGAGIVSFFVIESLFGKANRTLSIPQLTLTFLLGSSVLAVFWSILLSFSLFNLLTVITILITFTAVGILFIQHNRQAITLSIDVIYKLCIKETTVWKAIIFFNLTLILLTAIVCLSPLEPYNDAAAFYMVLPKLLASTNQYMLLSGYESFMKIGLYGELHFGALMLLGCEVGAKFYSWFFGLSTAIMIVAISGLAGVGRKGQILSVTMVYASTAFLFHIGDGKTDIFGAALGCATFYWIMKAEEEILSLKAKYFVLGVFTAFAMIAKISYALIILPSVFLFITIEQYSEKEDQNYNFEHAIGQVSKKSIWLLLGIAIPLFFHLHKNFVLFGEPFTPFFNFGENIYGDTWTNQTWITSKNIHKIILTYPFALVFGNYPFQIGTMSVLILAFVPLLVTAPLPNKILKNKLFLISLIAIMGIFIWIIIRPGIFAPRYILYTLLLLIPASVAGVEHVLNNEPNQKFLSAVIIVFCLIHLVYFNRIYFHKVKKRFTDNEIRISIERFFDHLNNVIPDSQRVLTLNYYNYYFRPDILENLVKYSEKDYIFTSRKQEYDNIRTRIYEKGFQFILLNTMTHKQHADNIISSKESTGMKLIKIIQNNEYVLYELKPALRKTM